MNVPCAKPQYYPFGMNWCRLAFHNILIWLVVNYHFVLSANLTATLFTFSLNSFVPWVCPYIVWIDSKKALTFQLRRQGAAAQLAACGDHNKPLVRPAVMR